MGIPVIAIGVPMVVDAVTLVSDMLEAMSENSREKLPSLRILYSDSRTVLEPKSTIAYFIGCFSFLLPALS